MDLSWTKGVSVKDEKRMRCILNQKLDMLHIASNPHRILLTADFRWFHPQYNGVSMYGHTSADYNLDLDACYTGLGGAWGAFFISFINT